MRRSLRDSIVGFSLLGGILTFTFFSFWLKGVRLSSKNWHLFAEFNNASGLSKKSPVTYRGILVGSIDDILFTNESIQAKIVLNNPEIILPKPAFARVVTNSFLGGDVQVALETSEKTISKNIAKPTSEKCDSKLIICQGDTITGKQLSSLSNITNRLSQLLKESNQENIIENIVKSIDQFDRTQENLDELIYLSKQEILRIEPLINEITIAANHLNKILSTIDNEETLNDIKLTINAASSISSKMDDVSDDFVKLTKDKELTKSIRDLTIGLSKFLNEIYP
ncbi:putative ABC transporter [Prochlorococcus marinus str. MIT 9312]|uniref:Putative ABC transporter n=1 Tax=Prochlorococcus marinus (strain MIT 9312) TaxID=74546 RepID=Q31CP3_PROM9|nr:MlaD family protein [Prochlorococcus marinus]ABB49352.1 putative ABC transporter [Prochlorococcus marinus str. MIT 9312]KGG00882.1 putative ABC transporter precursor [Prochlorococcus marinus str. MIT 9311]